MIELKKDFTKKGINFHQIMKDDNVVVYQLTRKYDNGAEESYLEIFKYNVKDADRYHSDEYEAYPSDEAFGKWAWCATKYEQIQKIIEKHFDGVDVDIISDISNGKIWKKMPKSVICTA